VTGKTSKTDKGGKTTEKGLTGGQEKKGKPKTAEQEAGVKKANNGIMSKLGRAVTFGGVGDESGIDLDDFTREREDVASLMDATAGVKDIEGGKAATVAANVGPRVSGD